MRHNAAQRSGIVVPMPLQHKESSSLSPVPELLACNLPPSDTETPLILNAIVEMEGSMTAIEEELADMTLSKQRLKALRKRKKQCTEFLHKHRSLLSPFRRLPADVLSEIFTQAAYSRLGTYSTPPWAISQTCSIWRTLALDLPFLWNCIVIQFDEKHMTRSFLQFLDMFLNRLREVPLDVFIFSVHFGRNYVEHPVIGILPKCCKRWRSLHLQVSGQTLQAFEEVKEHLDELQSLDLKLYAPFPETLIDIFEVAPQLQEIDTNGTSSSNHMPLVIPWRQIITYRDDFENPNSTAKILASATSLETLDFSCRNLTLLHFERLQAFPSVCLEKLWRFTIVFSEGYPRSEILPEDFLDGLTLPSLKELRLVNYYDWHIASVIKSLITRSHASLKILEFSCPSARNQIDLPGTLPSILQLTPQLTELITTLPNHTDLSNLIIDPQQPNIIVSSLQTLILHIPPSGVYVDFEQIMTALVVSRYGRSNVSDDISGSRASISIRLVFYDLANCFLTHELLENVHSPSKEYFIAEETLSELAILRSRFRGSLSRMSLCITAANYPGTKEIYRQVMGLFDEIDSFHFANAKEVYASSLHHLLYHVVRLIEKANTPKQEMVYSWKERAEAILDKLNTSLLIEDLPNRRWAFQGFQSIVYAPMEYEIDRSSSNASLTKIYGRQFYSDKYENDTWVFRFPSDLFCRDYWLEGPFDRFIAVS